jgi:3'(2'), 5'-bisphosphate nucleotidase
MGSSIKLCLVAEGSAHIYPRLGTATAHAVVNAAGGKVVDMNNNTLAYNKKDSLHNLHFIVHAG